ncbi:Glucan 1,3-beta-glucosidase [Drechslerella dactyloides]|uniref:Glucan 1,3-beta-glucosidase n=1 Tax=Drechslerella dactyloides TaxID=74499 RepID=A0AAD6IZ79_DREDA|nr:Glucan 1,3-beta-glucosidase [Drechslerella dactyloides]
MHFTGSLLGAVCALAHFASAVPILQRPSLVPYYGYRNDTSYHANVTAAGSYWLGDVQHQGVAAFNADPQSYKVFRNVKEFGAKGDGVTDDSDAINAAIQAGTRCMKGCDSSTTQPGLIYFPSGTYVVSKPIIAVYYSQLVGDAGNPPTLKAAASFSGIAVIDSDPYESDGSNWYTNQNNFFRAVRNFVIDLTATKAGTGIHWQVAQASSLINIRFEMGTTDSQGIFMDNGSGGFMSDLTFNGGKLGAFLGNQQFTTRNFVFKNVKTAMLINWNWGWTFKSLDIQDCGVGIDMTTGGASAQNVGSVLVLDSKISNTPVGVKTVHSATSMPITGGTLVIDNLLTNNVPAIVANNNSSPILAGSNGATTVESWGQGRVYSANGGSRVQANLTPKPQKPAALLDGNGNIFERSRPQYADVPASQIVSARSRGCKGDGKTDDTATLQALLSQNVGKVIYLDHGVYRLTSTLYIPPNTKLVGECWATLISDGAFFADSKNPKPVVQVGKPGETGIVELSDLVLETAGPAGGAILLEWNMADAYGQKGTNGMWDVHIRVGGSAGTHLQSDTCKKNPNSTAINNNCESAFMLMHVGKTGSVYMENNWIWTSDHELDQKDFSQITIYSGRGLWIETQQGPVWGYGTAAEHNVMYQYQLTDTKNVFLGMIQTETPYYQSNPTVYLPYEVNPAFQDPVYDCPDKNMGSTCAKAIGMRVKDSKDVLIYGAGLYSFFENYGQDCLKNQTCQDDMVSLEGSVQNFFMYNLNTVGVSNLVKLNGKKLVPQPENKNGFASTIAMFSQP